jgi:hypothetical protein
LASPGSVGTGSVAPAVPGIDSGWALYTDPVILEEPTDPSKAGTPGVYYGANGYQMGLDLRGENYFMEGGTTDSPVENESRRVLLGGPDFSNCVPGYDCNGFIGGLFASQVMRLTGIQYDSTLLMLQTQSTGSSGMNFTGKKSEEATSALYGVVVRWHDVEEPDYAVENVYSPSDATAVDLPPLPESGLPIYGLGDISNSGYIGVFGDDDEETEIVYDTDRWRLDLSEETPGELIEVAVWLDRRYEDMTGEIAPYDTWLAIAPEDWVPTPTVDEVNREQCSDDDAEAFAFPMTLIEYLFFQEILADAAYTTDGLDDYCGVIVDDLTCASDWDQDSVPDSSEPAPVSFVDQVNVRLCTLGSEESYSPSDWIDVDEIDEDDDPTRELAINCGGRSAESGEDSYLRTTLTGGESYLIVVGGNQDTGTYELTVRRLE